MRWVELFEGAGNRLSMMRLTVFLSFWPASYVLVTRPTETMVGLYLGAYVVGYLGGKSADIVVGHRQLAASGDSDTVSDTAVTSTVVAKRRTQVARGKRRAF